MLMLNKMKVYIFDDECSGHSNGCYGCGHGHDEHFYWRCKCLSCSGYCAYLIPDPRHRENVAVQCVTLFIYILFILDVSNFNAVETTCSYIIYDIRNYVTDL